MDKNDDHTNKTVQQLAELVGRSVKAPAVAVRAAHDFNSIMMAIGRSRRTTVMCVVNDCLFISSPLPKINFTESIAIGYLLFYIFIPLYKMIVNPPFQVSVIKPPNIAIYPDDIFRR
jgi:hypothetical protein